MLPPETPRPSPHTSQRPGGRSPQKKPACRSASKSFIRQEATRSPELRMSWGTALKAKAPPCPRRAWGVVGRQISSGTNTAWDVNFSLTWTLVLSEWSPPAKNSPFQGGFRLTAPRRLPSSQVPMGWVMPLSMGRRPWGQPARQEIIPGCIPLELHNPRDPARWPSLCVPAVTVLVTLLPAIPISRWKSAAGTLVI